MGRLGMQQTDGLHSTIAESGWSVGDSVPKTGGDVDVPLPAVVGQQDCKLAGLGRAVSLAVQLVGVAARPAPIGGPPERPLGFCLKFGKILIALPIGVVAVVVRAQLLGFFTYGLDHPVGLLSLPLRSTDNVLRSSGLAGGRGRRGPPR